ncbi:hypothetical protein Leryth_005676 [Lithospermum erythrorhizon]|nr:hypothetical protein Leryth_005676 [Lithospermum erythrorhizon]
MEPQDSSSSSSKVIKLLLQVTLIPNVGICIGVSNHHAVGDANAIFRFVKAWATLSKDGAATLSGELLPLYDRTLVKDPKNMKKAWWNLIGTLDFGDAFSKLLPTTTHKERATFVFDGETVKNLKSFAMSKNPALERLSTFIVVCAYVWTCLVKSRVATEENVNEQEAEYFGFVADARGRLDPPLPDNYFGNCLVYCYSPSKVKDLTGGGGFVLAVELIAECIKKRLFNKDGVLSDAENWFKDFANVDVKRMIGVAGSPKYNYYDLDFGFGKGRKFEFVSIDEQGSIAISGCRDGGGVIEVGLSLPKERMDAFVASFNEGLKGLNL